MVRSSSIILKGVFYSNGKGRGKIVATVNNKTFEYFVPDKFANNTPNLSEVNFVVDEYINGQIARITKVISINNDKVYGMVDHVNGEYVFIPSDSRYVGRIQLIQNELAGYAVGKKCCVKIISPANMPGTKQLVGIIESKEQVFSSVNSVNSNVEALKQEAGIRTQFPEEVLQQAASVPQFVSDDEIALVKDFRHIPFYTIDPPTCKDMDDAVYAEKWYENGVHVGYIIYEATAHVTHYLEQDSPIDKEAQLRAISHYLAGGVDPMLPENLSNGICSLNEEQDRLAMVTVAKVDLRGNVKEYDIHEGVIRSRTKFSYDQVDAIHDKDPVALETYNQYVNDINVLYEVEKVLSKKAKREGALDFQGFEPTIYLDEQKNTIIDFRNENRGLSHKLIEQIMVLTNYIWADVFANLSVPGIYRVHEEPDEKKFEKVLAILMEYGIDYAGEYGPKAYQELIDLIEDHPNKKALTDLIARSLPRAEYSTQFDVGHNGLALPWYMHSTSPIRRYSDDVVHRVMVDILNIYKNLQLHGEINSNVSLNKNLNKFRMLKGAQLSQLQSVEELNALCSHINVEEEKGDFLEQQVNLVCATNYMQQHLGEIKKGFIKTFNEDGVCVTLSDEEDPLHSDIIDVIVPFTELGLTDKYAINSFGTKIIDVKTQKVMYEFADGIFVKLLEADPNTRRIVATTDLHKQPVQQVEETPVLQLQPVH